ncbi:MAG: GNAT family N-acetyltransferase [Candidatus Coatesbacteria bacterium]|nr:MAG: GNAT family N-acetyltransferase [Candidatus Coatesbacteria bacterium]
MGEVTIRPMEPADLRAVWQLVHDNKPQFAPPGWPTTSLELQRMAFLHPRATPQGSLVAEAEGEVRGALVFHNYDGEKTAAICLICVEEEAQGSGLGGKLMASWEERARELGLRRLLAPETPEEDRKFIEFAKRLGFREVGKVVSWGRGDEPMEAPPDEHVVPIVNASLGEITEAFNECFPDMPRTQDDLYGMITQSQWGPWASLAYVEEGRVLAFLFTTDRDGKPYLQHVGTRPEARRRGLALQLLKQALRVLREGGAREVECEVYEDNEAAAKLAASFGMEPRSRRLALAKDLT